MKTAGLVYCPIRSEETIKGVDRANHSRGVGAQQWVGAYARRLRVKDSGRRVSPGVPVGEVALFNASGLIILDGIITRATMGSMLR